MLPPSSSSDEGPAPRERDFDGKPGNNARYPQEGTGGGNGGGNSRGRYSDEETEATASRGAGAGDDHDDIKSSPSGPPQASLDRALSHSELEELGFAAHLLLKISSSPMKRARVDLVSLKIVFFLSFRSSAPAPSFFFSCRQTPNENLLDRRQNSCPIPSTRPNKALRAVSSTHSLTARSKTSILSI